MKEFWCPQCGQGAKSDEDECCAQCGATLITEPVFRAISDAAAKDEREACAAIFDAKAEEWRNCAQAIRSRSGGGGK